MSPATEPDCFGHCRSMSMIGLSVALSLLISLPAQARPESWTPPELPDLSVLDQSPPADVETLGHIAAMVGDILDAASRRVDHLATRDRTPDLAAALRNELDLSRRWNRHLTAMLNQIVEARRDLDAQQRRVMADIAQFTALVEGANQELVTLGKALDLPAYPPLGAVRSKPHDADGRRSAHERTGADIDAVTRGLAGPGAHISDARATLADMREAQKSATRDAAVVRTKIIEALHRLASFQSDPSIEDEALGDMSSEDITAWAASIAGKLHDEGLDRE